MKQRKPYRESDCKANNLFLRAFIGGPNGRKYVENKTLNNHKNKHIFPHFCWDWNHKKNKTKNK